MQDGHISAAYPEKVTYPNLRKADRSALTNRDLLDTGRESCPLAAPVQLNEATCGHGQH